MTRLILALFCAFGLVTFEDARAAVVSTSGFVEVTKVTAYAGHGGGDVILELSAPVGNCTGAWLSPGDPGFEQNVAIVLSARMSGRPVLVYADDSAVWTGSSSSFCRLYAIAI